MAKAKTQKLEDAHIAALAGVALVAVMFWLNVIILNAPTGFPVMGPGTMLGGDTTPPTLENIRAVSNDNGVTVTWGTNEAAQSRVYYATAASYPAAGAQAPYQAATPLTADLLTFQRVTVQGLTAGTLYHYKVRSVDAAGNVNESDDSTFITTGGVICGNGKVDGSDQCDKTDMGGKTCADLPNFLGGALKCKVDCTFDTSECAAAPQGKSLAATPFMVDSWNENLNKWTACTGSGMDIAALDAFCACKGYGKASVCLFETKEDRYAYGGADTAANGCIKKGAFKGLGTALTYVACITPAPPTIECGNNILETGEECDTQKLNGKNCGSVMGTGYTGILDCLDDCTFDVSGCIAPTTAPVCGDGTCDTGESTTNCPEDCLIEEPTSACGNNILETDEECDGTKLGGKTCKSLGQDFTGGTLACDEYCLYDTSGCIAPEETETTPEQAQTSISSATTIIQEMKADGKNTSEATAMLKDAILTYNSGDFAGAKRTADMAKITALAAEDLQKPAELPITAILIGVLVIAAGGGLYYAMSKGIIKIGAAAAPQAKHAKAGAQT